MSFAKVLVCAGMLFIPAGCVSVDVGSVSISDQAPSRSLTKEGKEDLPTWWVSNNFRVISGAREQKRFERDLALFLEASKAWSDREAQAGIFPNILYEDLVQNHPDLGVEVDYDTAYDKQLHSYAGVTPDLKWALDSRRNIQISWPGESGKCQFQVFSGSSENDPEISFVADCAIQPTDALDKEIYCNNRNTRRLDEAEPSAVPSKAACVEVELNTSYRAVITNLSSGAERRLDDIRVEDKLIVAMGDSFSSGEGNPHMHWTLRQGSRPTVWWDERCHRSLLSGPSLASVFYARLHPQRSVTFMHYGCSGASMDDGLMRSWPLQETSQQRQNVHNFWLYRLLGYDPDPDQIPRCVSGSEHGNGLATFSDCFRTPSGVKLSTRQHTDILPSQISLAAHDLSESSTSPQANPTLNMLTRRPDALILSIGGNDVGFQELVSGIVYKGFRSYDFKPCKFRELEDEVDEHCLDSRVFARMDHARFTQAASIKRSFLKCVLNEIGTDRSLDVCASELPNKFFSPAKKADLVEATRSILNVPENLDTRPSKEHIERAHFVIGAMIRVAITIPDQYAKLEQKLGRALDPSRVIVTLYPDPVMYRELDNIAGERPFLPCEDKPLDKRPGMIPGIFGGLDFFGLGASKDDVAAADKYVLGELNGTISNSVAALESDSWTTINAKAFSDLTRPFGFCSIEGRFMNTIADAFFFQGLAGTAPELPLGNLTIGKDAYEWNVTKKKYVSVDQSHANDSPNQDLQDLSGNSAYSGPAILDRQPNFLAKEPRTRFRPTPMLRAKYAFRPTTRRASKLSAPTAFPPRGTFHPTVLGHCAYAGAILEKLLVDSDDRNEYRLSHVWQTNSQNPHWQKAFLYETICSAKALGWHFENPWPTK